MGDIIPSCAGCREERRRWPEGKPNPFTTEGMNLPSAADAVLIIHDDRCDCAINYPKRPAAGAKHVHVDTRQEVVSWRPASSPKGS